MRVTIFAVLVIFSALATASSKQGLDARRVQQDIQEKGPKDVAASLFAQKSSWATLTKNVRSGKNEWIDIAIRLRRGSDGGASSELQDALFAALATNPRHLLYTVAPTIPVRVLCSGRSDPLPTEKAAISEIDRVRKSVAEVHDKNLGEQRKDCLTALEDAKANTKRFFKD